MLLCVEVNIVPELLGYSSLLSSVRGRRSLLLRAYTPESSFIRSSPERRPDARLPRVRLRSSPLLSAETDPPAFDNPLPVVLTPSGYRLVALNMNFVCPLACQASFPRASKKSATDPARRTGGSVRAAAAATAAGSVISYGCRPSLTTTVSTTLCQPEADISACNPYR